MTHISDEEILTLIRGKGTANQGFASLMKKYREPIYWHVRRLVVSHEDAEDILQEAFINVFRFFESYKGDSKLYTWIYKIATNECARMFRNRKATYLSLDEAGEGLVNTLYETSADESDRILLLFQEAILRLRPVRSALAARGEPDAAGLPRRPALTFTRPRAVRAT